MRRPESCFSQGLFIPPSENANRQGKQIKDREHQKCGSQDLGDVPALDRGVDELARALVVESDPRDETDQQGSPRCCPL